MGAARGRKTIEMMGGYIGFKLFIAADMYVTLAFPFEPNAQYAIPHLGTDQVTHVFIFGTDRHRFFAFAEVKINAVADFDGMKTVPDCSGRSIGIVDDLRFCQVHQTSEKRNTDDPSHE